jgi:3-methylfumaryl-CoA hydratase
MDTPQHAGSDPKEWIGHSESHEDIVTAFPVAALAATLDRTDAAPLAADALRPLRHWLYFLAHARRSELGNDGHPERGGFLPPIALPRRMWAGGRLTFVAPLRIGARVRRVSTIVDVSEKTGRSGRLAFVLVRHELFEDSTLLLTEEHDIVYREAVSRGEPETSRSAATKTAAVSRDFVADATLLFRYSALTFNGHRIHYDRRYVTEEEGYPGLVVHGPLLATLLADFALDTNPGSELATFRFRAVAPIFDGSPFRLNAQAEADATIALWITNDDGTIAMEASATLRR